MSENKTSKSNSNKLDEKNNSNKNTFISSTKSSSIQDNVDIDKLKNQLNNKKIEINNNVQMSQISQKNLFSNLNDDDNLFDQVLNQVSKKNQVKKKKEREMNNDIKIEGSEFQDQNLIQKQALEKINYKNESNQSNNFKENIELLDSKINEQLLIKQDILQKSKKLCEDMNRPSNTEYINTIKKSSIVNKKKNEENKIRNSFKNNEYYEELDITIENQNSNLRNEVNKKSSNILKNIDNDDYYNEKAENENIETHKQSKDKNKYKRNFLETYLDENIVLDQYSEKKGQDSKILKKNSEGINKKIDLKTEKNENRNINEYKISGKVEQSYDPNKNKYDLINSGNNIKANNSGLNSKVKNDSFKDLSNIENNISNGYNDDNYYNDNDNHHDEFEQEESVLDVLESFNNTKKILPKSKQDKKNEKKSGIAEFFSGLLKPFKCGEDV